METETTMREQALAVLTGLVGEIVWAHKTPSSIDYNDCDKPGEECAWCSGAKSALAVLSTQEPSDEN